MLFRDRAEAGRQLAGRLTQFAGRRDVAVLPLNRDSDAVAFEIVEALHAVAATIRDAIVIVVADGLADADDVIDFVRALRQEHPRRILVATPVASNDARYDAALRADQVICLATPEPFVSIGEWYADNVWGAAALAGTY